MTGAWDGHEYGTDQGGTRDGEGSGRVREPGRVQGPVRDRDLGACRSMGVGGDISTEAWDGT